MKLIFEKASNHQLLVIFQYERDCPETLKGQARQEWNHRKRQKGKWLERATLEQLNSIYHHDQDCPTLLQEQVIKELARRGIKPQTPKKRSLESAKIQRGTNEELKAILDHDNEISKDLLHLAVHEAIDRGLYEGLVIKVINDLLPTPNAKAYVEHHYRLDFDDLMQIGYIGLFQAVRTFKAGKGGFTAVAYVPIQRSILTELKKYKSEGRTGMVNAVTIQKPFSPAEPQHTLEDILLSPYQKSVEAVVLEKIMVEEQLSFMNDIEKEVFYLRHQGYEFKEIGSRFGFTRQWAEKKYKQAKQKNQIRLRLLKGDTVEEIVMKIRVKKKTVINVQKVLSAV